MTTRLGHLPHEERLQRLGLFREKAPEEDMIERSKMMQGMDKVDRWKLFSLSCNTRTRGHTVELSVGKVRTDKRKYFLTQNVVSLWNILSWDVVMASGPDAFQMGLCRFLEEKSIAGDKP